jgi:hypothetical protein
MSEFDPISYGKASSASAALTSILQQSGVTEAANVFTCDLALRKNFSIAISDTNSKTIAFSNIPADLEFSTPIAIKVVCTAAAVVGTYPTGTVWQDDQSPIFVANKTYYLYFMRITNGWHASYVGAW